MRYGLCVALLLLAAAAHQSSASMSCIPKPSQSGSDLVFPINKLTPSQLTCFHDSTRCTKTKFSICLTLDPKKIEASKCSKVFTTGGESPYAFGSYLLYLGGRRYLLGLSGQDSASAQVKWDVEFEISDSTLPVSVCGTWEDRSGLTLYVDGMRAVIRQNGEEKRLQRYFLDAAVPYQETMMFCKGTDGVLPDQAGITDVCVEEAVWDADIIRVHNISHTDLSCTQEITLPSNIVAKTISLTSSVERYQQDCFENCGYFRSDPSSEVQMRQVYAIRKASDKYDECVCIGKLQSISQLTTIPCSDAASNSYHLYLTSQLYLPPVQRPFLNASVKSAYGDVMYTGDAVLFEIKTYSTTDAGDHAELNTNQFVIEIDFGDGAVNRLRQKVFSHTYPSAGDKTVKIKMITDFGATEIKKVISIKDKDTEQTVEIDVCKIFCDQSADGSPTIDCTAAIAGKLTKTAKFFLNNVQKQVSEVKEYSALLPSSLSVNEIGQFTVRVCAENGRTSKCAETRVIVGDHRSVVLHALLGENIELELPNAEAMKDNIRVVAKPDGRQISFTASKDKLILDKVSLTELGFLQAQVQVLYDSQYVLLSRQLMMKSCPSLLKIEPAKLSGLKNDNFPVKFRIKGIGRLEVRLCDGYHECEYLVIDGLNGERVIDRIYRYNRMGIFWVSFKVGTSICSKEERVMIGTQVPISDVVVHVPELMTIKNDLIVNVFINRESRLPIGGEGNKARIQLGTESEKVYDLHGNLSFFGPFVLRYPVTKYGQFQLIVRLENDIGSVTKLQTVKIGSAISGISTQVLQPIANWNKEAKFVLNLHSGHPLTFEFKTVGFWHKIGPFNPRDYPDSTKLMMWRLKQGANYSMVPSSPITFTLSESTTAASAEFEMTGSVEIQNYGRSLTFSMLGHNFDVGSNQIDLRLSNSFGAAQEAKVCGEIIYSKNSETCRIESSFRDATGRDLFVDDVIEIEKSSDLNIAAVSSANGVCSESDWVYNWEILKVIDESKDVKSVSNLHPLNSQCSSTNIPQFTVNKHSLQYGIYQVCVFGSPNNFPLNSAGNSRQCQTVKVVRSKLVCKFRGEVDRGVNFGEVLDLDYSQCSDPDDLIGNNTLSFVASCVSEGQSEIFGKSDCCSIDFQKNSDWQLLPIINNSSSSASVSNLQFYDHKGLCFPNPSLVAHKDRVVYAEPEALNNNDMMEMCICGSDQMNRHASSKITVKVLVIRNIQDAQNTLNELDVSNPSRALAVISIIGGTLKESNDTDLVSEVKEAASSKVAEVSKNLNDPDQTVTLGETLASLTDGGVTENTKLTSSLALGNTADKLAQFSSANSNQVAGATRGSASTVANIQPVRTPADQSNLDCVVNMRRMGFDRPDFCGVESEESVTTARRRRSVMVNPLDPDLHEHALKAPRSARCELPDEISDSRMFYHVKSCEELKEQLLYVMPDMLSEYLDSLEIQRFSGIEESRKKSGEITKKGTGALKSCAGTALTKGDKSEVVSKSIAVKAVKAPAKLDDDEDAVGSDSNDGGVNIPQSLMESGMGLAMQTYGTNPICHGDRAMNSAAVSITRNDASGQEVKTKGVKEPISVFIKRTSGKSNCVLYPMKHDDKYGNCHCMNLTKDNQAIGVYVRDLKNDTESSDASFQVYLKNGSCPDPVSSNFSWSGTLPRSSEEIRQNLSRSDLKRLNNAEGLLLEKELRNTLILPLELTKTAGQYCVFVTLKSANVQFDTSGQAVHGNMVYEYCSHVENPAYFDDQTESWKSDGVEIGGLSCKSQSHLKVTHLTSFASDFVVPPNTIDFTNVWAKFKNLSENAAVFSVVISLIILYIILMIWGRIMDKKDIQRWGATNLKDNLPTDTYMYQISVMTGYRQGSGTKSKPHFIISGDAGDTGIRELNDGERKGFPRGTVYNFVMSSESCLGQLTFLRIWHDNSGKGDHRSWYLDQVVVNDLQTGDKFFFLCNNWLAVEEGDGLVERILPVSGLADLVAFKQLFSSSVQRKLRNEHLWFSIFSRPTRSVFTRTQRISCCLSLLFLTMITNAMFFRADENMDKKTGVTVGPITFTLDQIFISLVSTLIVFPPSIIIITFFKKCRAKAVGNKVVQQHQDLSTKSNKYTWRSINKGSQLFNIATDEEGGDQASGWDSGESSMSKKNNKVWKNLKDLVTFKDKAKETVDDPDQNSKKKPFLFPHWCIYIAWLLVFLSVFGSAFFVILYSMEWGRDRANDWLITFVLSFVQNVIVVQPVKVLLLAAVISMIIKKPEADDEEAAFDEAMADENRAEIDKQLLEKKAVDIQQIMLQRRTAREDLYSPNQEKLSEIREMRLKELKMEAIIKEMFAYAIFVLIVFFISYQTRSMNSFKLGEVMRNTFTRPFKNSVPTYGAFFKYLNKTLIPNMYAGDFENGKRATWRDKLAINDGSRNIMRVGVPRLRQFRIKDDTCKTHKDFKTIITKPCRSAYGWIDDDTKSYEPFWEPMDEEKWKRQKKNESFKSPFVYRSSIDLKGLPYMAQVSTYKGGGYVLNFPRTKELTQAAIDEIFDLNWLDTRTRGVFIEFTVYNAPSNLFASVIMVAEFLETGGSVTFTEVKVFRLFSYVGSFGAIVMFMEVVFALFVGYFCFREGMQMKELRCKYFNGFWNLLEFTTLCITTVAVVMYIFKKILASVAMDALSEAKSDDYVNFGSIATYDELYAYMVGIVVFISTVKFIKVLRFNKRMGMLGATIKLAAKDLKSFMVMFFVYFMAFCHSAYLIFGRQLLSYGSFIGTWEALFSMALGSFNFHELHSVNGLLGPIFFFSFVCLVSFALLGIFLTIINDAFSVVKANAEMQGNEYELVEFMTKRAKNLLGCSTMGGNEAEDACSEADSTERGEVDDDKATAASASFSGSLSKLKF